MVQSDVPGRRFCHQERDTAVVVAVAAVTLLEKDDDV